MEYLSNYLPADWWKYDQGWTGPTNTNGGDTGGGDTHTILTTMPKNLLISKCLSVNTKKVHPVHKIHKIHKKPKYSRIASEVDITNIVHTRRLNRFPGRCPMTWRTFGCSEYY